jgi:hypothetical protein
MKRHERPQEEMGVILNPVSGSLVLTCQFSGRKWKLESGNWRVETGGWKLETGNWSVDLVIVVQNGPTGLVSGSGLSSRVT